MKTTLEVTFIYNNASGLFEGVFPNGTRFAFASQLGLPVKLATALAGLRQTTQLVAEGAKPKATPAAILVREAKGFPVNRLVPRKLRKLDIEDLEIEI